MSIKLPKKRIYIILLFPNPLPLLPVGLTIISINLGIY